MKSKIKIVILTSGFSADETDTTTSPSLQMYVRNLKSIYSGIDLNIIAFHYPARKETYLWEETTVIAAGGKKRAGGRILLWIRILLRLFRLKKESGIDLIHAFWIGDTALLGSLFSFFTDVPLLVTAMGQDVKKENRYLRILNISKINLVFISQFQADYNSSLLKNGRSKVIPFGTDNSFFKIKNETRFIDILAVGSLNQVKNYQDLIEIIKILSGEFPVLKCRIIGEGSERGEIEKNIKDNSLDNIIKLEGQLSYQDVISEMHSSCILLHTSHFEGQGLVITEALASGAYVVCYPIGIAYDLKSKKLYTGSTKEELCRYLAEILHKTEPDFSPEYVLSIDETCRMYTEIYRDLIHND